MLAQKYVQKELNLINENYFAIYNTAIDRWQVRKWLGIYPKKFSLWKEFSENILTIRQEKMTDEGLRDAGYEDIDMRTIDAIRRSHWWKLKWKKKISELDWRNEKKERHAQAELEYESKYVAKRIWRTRHEPTINLSGKDWVR